MKASVQCLLLCSLAVVGSITPESSNQSRVVKSKNHPRRDNFMTKNSARDIGSNYGYFDDKIRQNSSKQDARPKIRINEAWIWRKKQLMRKRRLYLTKSQRKLFLKKYNPRKYELGKISGKPSLSNNSERRKKVIIRVPRLYVTNQEAPLDLRDIKMVLLKRRNYGQEEDASQFFKFVMTLIEDRNSGGGTTFGELKSVKRKRYLLKLRGISKKKNSL